MEQQKKTHINVVGIDVVRTVLSILRLQTDTRVVIWNTHTVLTGLLVVVAMLNLIIFNEFLQSKQS